MHRMGAQVHELGANEPICTPLATPLSKHVRHCLGVDNIFVVGGGWACIATLNFVTTTILDCQAHPFCQK